MAGDEETVLLLPVDPDASAAALRADLTKALDMPLAVIITDSWGRPWRLGTTGIAIGCAGVTVLDDRRGQRDMFGREMQVAEVAIADGMAAAASLLMGEGGERSPVVLMRFDRDTFADDSGQNASSVIRPANEDLFR